MFILLSGPDTFRLHVKLREIVAAYRAKYGTQINETRISANDCAFDDFVREAGRRSLFAQKRLILVANFLENKLFAESLADYPHKQDLQKNQDTVVVLWDSQPCSGHGQAKKILALSSRAQEFPLLSFPRFREWSAKLAEQHNLRLEPKALALLAQWGAGDSWYVAGEIQKLRAYGTGGSVTIEDIRRFATAPASLRVFSMADSLFAGRGAEGLAMLQEHIAAGETPQYLLGMLARELRFVALLKGVLDGGRRTMNIAGLGIPPFALRKYKGYADRVSWHGVRDALDAFYSSDCAIKKGALRPAVGLELLSYKIIRLFPRRA